MAQVELNGAQNGAHIVVHAGDVVTIRLTEHSGGGYRWTPSSVDAARLELQQHDYETARAGVGSAGASAWRFVALTPDARGSSETAAAMGTVRFRGRAILGRSRDSRLRTNRRAPLLSCACARGRSSCRPVRGSAAARIDRGRECRRPSIPPRC